MKKRFLTALIVLFTLVFSLAIFAACGDEGGEEGGEGGFTINEQSVTIGVGDNHTLMARASGKSVTWESSDTSVVSIKTQVASRGTCVIYGEGRGTATLTAKASSGETATCTVTVEEITIELSATSLTILRKADFSYESKTLTATVMRNGVAGSGSVTWKSSDESVVSVAGGVLTAHKLGSATITATLTGGTAKATCEVNVTWENQPEGWYEVQETGSNGAVETPGMWTWSGFKGADDDVHPKLFGEGSSAEGKATFTVSGNTGWRWYGTQIFYKHPGTEANALVAGAVYKLTFKLESTADGAITVNDNDVEVKTGTQTVEVIYREAGGGEASITIAFATHDKIRNDVNTIGQLKEGTVTISDLKWEPYTTTILHAPTAFTVASDGEIQITDDNDDSTFEGYVIGFFKEGDTEPSYTQPIMKPVKDRDILADRGGVPDIANDKGERPENAGKMYLDDSFVEADTYTLKVKTYCGTALFEASPWSDVTVSRTVTHESGVDYKVLESYRDVDRGIGRYYVWAEWGQFDLGACNFKNNALTLTLKGESSWYSNQVYYDIPGGLETDHLYKYQFTLNYKTDSGNDLAGRQFVINGQRIDVTSEAQHTYTIYFVYTGGLAVSMLLGQPTADWQGTVENGGLPAGTYTFSDISLADMTEGNEAMIFGDYSDSKSDAASVEDQLVFWYAALNDWAEGKASIAMRDFSYEASEESDTGYSYHFSYKITPTDNQVCNWIFRLWYKNTKVTNEKQYHITLTINASEAGDILVNDETIHLEAGEHTYKVYPNDVTAPLSISMATLTSMTGTSENGMDITFKSIKWEEGGRTPLAAPTGTVSDNGVVTFTDPNNGTGVDHAEIGLFENDALIFTQTVENGGKVAAGMYQIGTYTIKLRLVAQEDYTDTGWVELGKYTVTDGYDLDSRLEQDTDHAANHPGQWYHWLDHWDWEGSTAKATKSEIDMGNKTFTFGFTTEGTPRLGYGVQLYYKNPDNVRGRTYTFTANITLSVDGTITVNNQQVTLKAGQKTPVSIRYSETDLSISIQTGVYQGTPVMNGELTISDWNWTEITGNPNGDEYDLPHTLLKEGEIPADSTFYYNSQYSQMTEAKFDHGTVSFKLSGNGNWYSNQIFYNSAAFPKDGTYTLKLKIHSTVAGKIRVNGKEQTLVVGDNNIEVTGTNGMFSLQMGMPKWVGPGENDFEWGGGITTDSVKDGEFTLSDFSWTTADGTVYGLEGRNS